ELLLETARAESELLAHRDSGLTEPLFETVFEPVASDAGEMAPDTVLRVRFARPALQLRYQADVLDADGTARIGGYHLTALALIAADPDAEHARQTLLSAEEVRF